MSNIQYSVPPEELARTQGFCSCVPPGSLAGAEIGVWTALDYQEELIPLAPALNQRLQATLTEHFPRSTPFSLLLLHVTQFEHIQMPPNSSVVHKKVSSHAPASFLVQVLHLIQRTLRVGDQLLIDEDGSGAVFLFPQVDQVGIASIAGRISYSINLLQAETVVPPLRQQTEIVLGIGSYPEDDSPAQLLAQAGHVRERVVFRPAVLPGPALQRPRPRPLRSTGTGRRGSSGTRPSRLQGVPFMQIPSRLPTRLKQLIPYTLALELRCAPVGRDHNRLTVAMADPTDKRAIYLLNEATDMVIFPVSCEPTALETLLASKW
ncbi:MAG TPA: hypothetical protein VGD98_19855 [Ktedonobacteraceae bacterium]